MSDPALLVRARKLRAARGVVVARDVTLAAVAGDVVAVEGPNGSGKSTLLAAAAGLLPADGASVRPGSVGYSPERAGTLPRVPLWRWLLGLARTAGLDREESARRAGDLIGRLGLTHASAVSLHALSRGNAQRALVAQALLADPDLLGPGCSPRRSGSWPPRCCSWSCWGSSTRPTPVPRCRRRRSPR